LLGVSGMTGFGTTAAAGTIVVTNVSLGSANHGGNAKISTTYDDTGYSEDSLTTGAAGITTTYRNLATSAQLDVNAAIDVGSVVVDQIGAAGTNSLTLNVQGGTPTIDALTVSGDNLLTINAGGALTIHSLVDAANTLERVTIAGDH